MFLKSNIIVVTLLWLCLVNTTLSARILFFMVAPSLSHHIFFRHLIKELSFRGHEVVSISPDPMNDPKLTNLTEIDIHEEVYSSFDARAWLEAVQYNKPSDVELMRLFLPLFHLAADRMLSAPKVQELIHNKNEHFDLVIVEMLMFNGHLFGLAERFNSPTIGLASLDTTLNAMDAIGNSPDPNYYGGFFCESSGGNLSFWERLQVLWHHIDIRYYYYFQYLPIADEMLRKHFNITDKKAWDLEKSVDLILTNTNPIFHIPRPKVPTYIDIGGLHIRERKPLPKDLKQFLDDSKQGVIYFSLGSNVQSANLPDDKRTTILNVFRQLPYNILWKWENDTLHDKPKNVLTQSWLPQQDVLDHPNLKAFVMHGGLQSIEEAIRSNVPLVGWVKADTKAIQAIHDHVITQNPRVSVSQNDYSIWNLHIKNVQEEDRGQYMCQINTDPMKSQVGHLNVVVPPDIIDSGDGQVSDVLAPEGGVVQLRCRARGHPTPHITWRREDSHDIFIRDGQRAKAYHVYEGEVLRLPRVSRTDMGAYLCIASNGVPPTVSMRFVVSVQFHPLIQVPNQLLGAPLGTDVKLECYVEASPKSINYWIRDSGEMVISSEKYEVKHITRSMFEEHMLLTVRNLQSDDVGSYKCVAKNALGEEESSIRIYEIPGPTRKGQSARYDEEDYNGSAEKEIDEELSNIIGDHHRNIMPSTNWDPNSKSSIRLQEPHHILNDNRIPGGMSSTAEDSNNIASSSSSISSSPYPLTPIIISKTLLLYITNTISILFTTNSINYYIIPYIFLIIINIIIRN